MLNLVGCDLDLDLHTIWQESTGIPTPPPCLATDQEQPRQILSDEREPTGCAVSGPSSIESFLQPTYDNDKLPVFKWLGPDPLPVSTQASDIFFFMSAFAFPTDVHCIEFRRVQFDGKSGEITEGYLFFLPNLRRPRGISGGYANGC